MDARKDAKTMERRGFFKMVGLGAVAGAATLANAPREAEAGAAVEASGSGYRETELVKKYYELSKL
ncbi:MAG: formate dehydrogenase [Proteobacteria bacterium]|nr:formate dehydrogenase [Pseudomonadota bacterium]